MITHAYAAAMIYSYYNILWGKYIAIAIYAWFWFSYIL